MKKNCNNIYEYYFVQGTLVISSRLLFHLILPLWVSCLFQSFPINRGGKGSAENGTDLPKTTAGKWWCWHPNLGDGDLTTPDIQGTDCVHTDGSKGSLRAEWGGGDTPKRTFPWPAGSQALRRVQHSLLVGIQLFIPSLPPRERWQGTKKTWKRENTENSQIRKYLNLCRFVTEW